MIKIFGAAFDPLDIAERVEIKAAYVNWLETQGAPEDDFLDPYDFLENMMQEKRNSDDNVAWIGKVQIDSWLSPKPSLADIKKISQHRYTEFLDNNGCYDYYKIIIDYLNKNVGDAIPLMVGVDHCLTGGVLRYLKDRYEEYKVIIFDSHCDLIDLETRKKYYEPFLDDPAVGCGGKDIYECGSFLNHLLQEKIIEPANLWIVGAQDIDDFRESSGELYRQKIMPWIEKGLHIISKKDFLLSGIPDEIEGRTYISFDMDLGSVNSVIAARFLNYSGLNARQFLALVNELSEKIKSRKIELIGLDIMEIDIHFLGDTIEGNKDRTPEIAKAILNNLIYGNFNN